MTTNHRIKVKLGDAEFEAEGAEDKVQAQYDQFLAACTHVSPKTGNKPPLGKQDAREAADLDDAMIAKAFELRSDGVVTLRRRPPDTMESADKIALLLYGYRRLKNEEHVLATQLLRAASLSGLGIERIDRAADAYMPTFIMRGGQKKGTNYLLTTQGIGKAAELAMQLLA
jgi:hypothetical protein